MPPYAVFKKKKKRKKKKIMYNSDMILEKERHIYDIMIKYI